LREWMKSLRLHKYTERLLGLAYGELLALSEADLQRLEFTDGARGKFWKQLQLVKERPAKLAELKRSLDEIEDFPRDLPRVIGELEKIAFMPLPCAVGSSASASEADAAQTLFDALEKTFSVIICRQCDDQDRDRVVVTFFR